MDILLDNVDNESTSKKAALIPGKRGYMKCDYISDIPYYISYYKNQPIKLIKVCENQETLVVMTKEGLIGNVGESNVQFFYEYHLNFLEFYHGDTPSDVINDILKHTEPGSYLLRNSWTIPNGLSLDLKCLCKEKIHRIRIINKKSLFYVNEYAFEDIEDIMNKLTFHEDEPHYPIKLEYPIVPRNYNFGLFLAKMLTDNGEDLWPTNIVINEKIGSGKCGDIFKGRYNFADVAVKCVKKTMPSDLSECTIFDEVAIMHELYHTNVVNLIGCVVDDQKITRVVFEWCDEGNLYNFLVKNNDVTPEERLEFCRNVIDGLEYLHRKNIVHGDISAKNVLLTKSFIAKISDFGLAGYRRRKVPLKSTNSQRWMAPESLQSKMLNLVSDVWSFGVFMWEVYSDGLIPYSEFNLYDLYDIIVFKGIRLDPPENCPDEIYSIMLLCWEINVKQRKAITRINNKLKKKYVKKIRTYNFDQ